MMTMPGTAARTSLDPRRWARTALTRKRREWTWVGVLARGFVLLGFAAWAAGAERPNILWITCEDISPNLGCFGDTYAVTPHLDALAAQGVRYSHAFAPIGVCAPSRSCLITGMFPPSIGTQYMRCQGQLPAGVKCFPQYLREAGYYCTNNSKTDYNLQHPKATWDESSNRAHWRGRQAGQPFFSVFNFTSCHESQIRLSEAAYRQRTAKFSGAERHDPAKAQVPPYHPDTPEVRRDWARYADMITFMDQEAGTVLKQLTEDGLADNTIVFFFSDHGAGMPRCKRWLYDSSLRVPLIVKFPAQHAHWAPAEPGQVTDRLVSFVDFGATILSLAGVDVPAHIQGSPFLGNLAGPPRSYVHGFRDRMDERYDMLRAVRDQRYKYIRNFLPHLPYFHHQHISYMYEMPTMRVWQELANAKQLRGPPAVFMALQKPPEELYDTESDPFEVNNLAMDAAHRPVLDRMRSELSRWQLEIRDLGFLPEAELRARWEGRSPFDAVRQMPEAYPYEAIRSCALAASSLDAGRAAQLVEAAAHTDPACRFWAATGLGALGELEPVHARKTASEALERLLQDPVAIVRVAAADALCRCGQTSRALPVLRAALQDPNEWTRLYAINVVDRIDTEAESLRELVLAAKRDANPYVVRVAEHAWER